ncbi:hypothetical protein ACJX0J_024194 [Zea mays]
MIIEDEYHEGQGYKNATFMYISNPGLFNNNLYEIYESHATVMFIKFHTFASLICLKRLIAHVGSGAAFGTFYRMYYYDPYLKIIGTFGIFEEIFSLTFFFQNIMSAVSVSTCALVSKIYTLGLVHVSSKLPQIDIYRAKMEEQPFPRRKNFHISI